MPAYLAAASETVEGEEGEIPPLLLASTVAAITGLLGEMTTARLELKAGKDKPEAAVQSYGAKGTFTFAGGAAAGAKPHRRQGAGLCGATGCGPQQPAAASGQGTVGPMHKGRAVHHPRDSHDS